MNWVQLGGSIVAILVLTGIAWALKLGGGGIAGEPAAKRAAEDALSGFEAVEAIVARDGRTALVQGVDGSVAALKVHGARIAARRVAAESVRETGQGFTIDTGERLFGIVVVDR